jgi:hypothetical protein
MVQWYPEPPKASEEPEKWRPIATCSDDGVVVVWNGRPYLGHYYQDPEGWFADVEGELLRIFPQPTYWIPAPLSGATE